MVFFFQKCSGSKMSDARYFPTRIPGNGKEKFSVYPQPSNAQNEGHPGNEYPVLVMRWNDNA